MFRSVSYLLHFLGRLSKVAHAQSVGGKHVAEKAIHQTPVRGRAAGLQRTGNFVLEAEFPRSQKGLTNVLYLRIK